MGIVKPNDQNLNKVTQAIVLSILIDTIMQNYTHTKREESTQTINTIKARVRKYIFKKQKTNKREFLEALKITQGLWNEGLDFFEATNATIEPVSTVIRFYNLYSEILAKNVGLTEKLIESFTHTTSKFSTLEIEQHSYKLADVILEKLSVFTGVKPKKLNIKKG